ncbi:hypothetical protein QZH41_009585 [Actinostola sp. cb2023]|nr:hypothetical protein QZH41_009585 [Actinostola sp. cb2023]
MRRGRNHPYAMLVLNKRARDKQTAIAFVLSDINGVQFPFGFATLSQLFLLCHLIQTMAPIFLLLTCYFVYSLGAVDGSPPTCISVMTKYRAKGLLQSDVPSRALSDSSLQVCSSSASGCCTKRMEDSFSSLARSEFESALTTKTNDLKNTFANSAKAFDVFFRDLIKNSEKDLNSMFLKTYGVFYKQRSQVFIDLFQSLNQYYNGKNLDLGQVMNGFFANLMRQMFQLLNSKYKFTKVYLDCVTRFMDDLKPFGDMKDKLTLQVKRSFVAARAFVYGLNVGHSVLRQLQAITASRGCEKEIIKMSYCSWCLGKTDLKPCEAFCMDSYKVCMADLKELNVAWENFVTALLEVVGKLEGPFSIENVIDPIGVKISFAIMNYQERHLTVGKKIFAGCGTPHIKAKTKRSSDSDFFIDEPGKVKRQANSKALDPAQSTASSITNLGRLTKKFRDDVKVAKGFWQRLPSAICNSPTSSQDSSQCWNGTALGKYTSPGVSINNIDSSLSPSDDIIRQQVNILNTMTTRLKSALEGEDVNVVGSGNTDGSGSGSGSGSGDGNEITSEPSTDPPTTSENEVDGDDNMQGGGVGDNPKGGNVLGKRGANSCHTLSSTQSLLATTLLTVFVSSRWC